MARLLRRDLPDGTYHVTTRGVDGTAIFRDDSDRLEFLRLLAEVVARFAWRCHAFCLMDNHYHLVVETSRADLSRGVKRLNGVYAQRFNRRHVRRGHLFGDRFWSSLIASEEHLRSACVYVVWNAVRAGLAASPREWRWCASRARIELDPAPTMLAA